MIKVYKKKQLKIHSLYLLYCRVVQIDHKYQLDNANFLTNGISLLVLIYSNMYQKLLANNTTVASSC